MEDQFLWVFTGVYGPVCRVDRGEFLSELEVVAFRWSEPWCMGGDFNMMRWLSKRVGSSWESGSMWSFCSFIDELYLIDLSLQRERVTWSNGQSLSRIDLFLISK